MEVCFSSSKPTVWKTLPKSANARTCYQRCNNLIEATPDPREASPPPPPPLATKTHTKTDRVTVATKTPTTSVVGRNPQFSQAQEITATTLSATMRGLRPIRKNNLKISYSKWMPKRPGETSRRILITSPSLMRKMKLKRMRLEIWHLKRLLQGARRSRIRMDKRPLLPIQAW